MNQKYIFLKVNFFIFSQFFHYYFFSKNHNPLKEPRY
jgi:hypothetical protein